MVRDIIKIQMKELKNNNEKNSGIKSAFKYASKQNKENTERIQILKEWFKMKLINVF